MITSKKAAKLYRFIKEGHIKFDGSHDIYTPQPLAEEILGKLELTGDILVLFNVEFVISLVYTYGVDASRITFYSDHPNKNKLLQKIGVTNYLDTLDNNMKFDVVIGNPPYQDDVAASGRKTATKPLWFDFVELSTKLVTKSGRIALITPSAWIQPTSKIHNTMCINNTVELAKVFAKSPFRGVTTTASYWVMRLGTGSQTYPLVIDDKVFNVPTCGFAPANPTQFGTTMSILTKTINATGGKLNFVATQEHHTGSKADRLSANKTSTHIYPVFHTNTQTKWSDTKGTLHNTHKVIVSKTGSLNGAFVDYSSSVSQIALACVVNTQAEANIVLGVVQSKLYRFLVGAVRVNSTIPSDLWRSLPAVDLTRSWTDQELYTHFNLTQEEVDLIEATVK
jgi:site-specific DNA-methyltransferase (adenine-specific)